MIWFKTVDRKPPVDGSHFWAWSSRNGIQKVKWQTGKEFARRYGGRASEFEDAFVTVMNDDEFFFSYWAPLRSIPEPKK